MSGPLVRRLPTRSLQQFILGANNNIYIKKKLKKLKESNFGLLGKLVFSIQGWENSFGKKVDLKPFSKKKKKIFLQGAVGFRNRARALVNLLGGKEIVFLGN